MEKRYGVTWVGILSMTRNLNALRNVLEVVLEIKADARLIKEVYAFLRLSMFVVPWILDQWICYSQMV